MNVLTNINLNQNELQNAVLQPLAVAPSNPKLGQLYYNSVDKLVYQYNGSAWEAVGKAYQLPIANASTLGGVKPVAKTDSMTQEVGVDAEGGLWVIPPDEYALPTASATVKGGVKIGEGIEVTSEGVISLADDVVRDEDYVHTDNNFTDALEEKLDGIENGAQVNILETITVGGSATPVTVNGKNADLAVLPTAGGTMSGDIAMGGHTVKGLANATADTDAVAYGQLPTTPVITATSTAYDGDTVTVTKSTLNIKTGVVSSIEEVIALADEDNAGLMSPASVQALGDLQTRVEALEGTTVRLLYTDKTDPSQQEIEAFVRAAGYTDPQKWSGIGVVIAGTYHIWHYYANDSIGWRDDGVDTVSQFTNEVAGIIKGTNEDGKVYAENDGTGSVVGWDDLKSRVSNVETNKADKTELPSATAVASGTISATEGTPNTLTVAYQGTYLSSYVTDGTGEQVITDVVVNAANVVFTVAQKPQTTLTCRVIYLAN